MIEIVTYKELMVKYPEAAEDIEKLKDSKNAAIAGIKLVYFAAGLIVSHLAFVLLPSLLWT